MGNLHTVGHIFNPLITDDAFWRLTLAVCYQLVQSVFFFFCASKKGGIGGGGEFQRRPRVAALAGCRTALVATGWMIFQHVSTNGPKNHSATPVGAPFLGL